MVSYYAVYHYLCPCMEILFICYVDSNYWLRASTGTAFIWGDEPRVVSIAIGCFITTRARLIMRDFQDTFR